MLAVHHFCSSAGLYELQNLIGVVAVTSKAVATLPLISAVAAEGMHRFLGMVAVLHFCTFARLYELQKLIGVVAVTSKAVATLPLTAAVLQRACTGS